MDDKSDGNEAMKRLNDLVGRVIRAFATVLKGADGGRLTYDALRCTNAELRINQRGPIHRPRVSP